MSRLLRALLAAAVAALVTPTAAGAADDAASGLGGGTRDLDPNWQLNTTLVGRDYSIQDLSAGTEYGGASEQVSLETIGFLTPLVEDGSPYSLRPFLQRTSRWSMTFDVGHFATRNPFGGADRTDSNGGVNGALNVYLKRWLALTGGLGYDYDVLHDVDLDQATHAVSGFAGLGLRFRDTRFDISYSQAAHESAGSFAPLRRGALQLSVFTAVDRRFDADLSIAAIPGGGQGSLALEYYPTQELGIFASGFAGKGEFYFDDVVAKRYVGAAGLSDWIDPTVGFIAQYSLTIEDRAEQIVGPLIYDGSREVSHTVSLEVYLRFP